MLIGWEGCVFNRLDIGCYGCSNRACGGDKVFTEFVPDAVKPLLKEYKEKADQEKKMLEKAA